MFHWGKQERVEGFNNVINDGEPIYLITKGKQFILSQDWVYKHETLGYLTVRRGFYSDLASVPLPLFWWQFGKWNLAAIPHDFIYENGYLLVNDLEQQMTKKEADDLFYHILKDVGVTPLTAFAMFLAVSWFGRGDFDRQKLG